MPNVVVKENHLTFGGAAYFRGHAEDVEIGSIGERRTPLTKQNYLEVKDRISVDKIKVMKSTMVEIDTSKLSKTDVNTQVNAIVPVSGVPVPTALGVEAAFEKLKSNELKLVKFSVMNNDIRTYAKVIIEGSPTWAKTGNFIQHERNRDTPCLLPISTGQPDQLHVDELCGSLRCLQPRCYQPVSAWRTDHSEVDLGQRARGYRVGHRGIPAVR